MMHTIELYCTIILALMEFQQLQFPQIDEYLFKLHLLGILLQMQVDMVIQFALPAPAGVTISSVNDLYNYLATYVQPRATTTQQEWEITNDLGDSHCESLGQGGALLANSTNQRLLVKFM